MYLDESLVRIVANFKNDRSTAALEKVQDKYGKSELDIPKDRVASMEEAVGMSSLLTVLANPFGMEKSCGDCKLTAFAQHLVSDHVYLRRDKDVLSYLTLFSDVVLDEAAKNHDDKAKTEIASEKEKNSF